MAQTGSTTAVRGVTARGAGLNWRSSLSAVFAQLSLLAVLAVAGVVYFGVLASAATIASVLVVAAPSGVPTAVALLAALAIVAATPALAKRILLTATQQARTR